MLINKVATEEVALLEINIWNRNGTLRLVGEVTTETVTLQQPTVTQDEADINNNAHWADIVFDSTVYLLDVDNTMRGVPYTGKYRVKKDAGVSGNQFGVEYV